MANKKTTNKTRLNATIPQKVDAQLTEYANEYGLSKSAAVGMILQLYFEQKDILERSKQMPTMIQQLQAMVEQTKSNPVNDK